MLKDPVIMSIFTIIMYTYSYIPLIVLTIYIKMLLLFKKSTNCI